MEALRQFVPVFILFLLMSGCTDGSSFEANNGEPEHIVVISPAIAEILESIDMLDRVVGIGQFGPWPGSIKNLPVAGGYDNPNVEQIIRLGAETVLNVKSQAATRAHQQLRNVGIEVIELDTSTYEGIFDAIIRLGQRFNRQARASSLAESMRRDIAEIRSLTDTLTEKRVLFVVGREPLYVAGQSSHIDFLIDLAGGKNIVQDSDAPYQQISLETILERKPEVIIDTSQNYPGAERGHFAGDWKRWPFIPAVREDQVYQVDPSQMVIPGIRLASMARLMGKFIHPEVFGIPTREDYLSHVGTNDDT